MIDKGVGFCPFPFQQQIDAYVTPFSQLIGNSTKILHTNDRLNLLAISEIVVMENDLVKNETWAEAVEANFEIQFWPYIQSNQTKTCVNEVMEISPINIFKFSGAQKLAVSAIAIGLYLY